MPSNPSRSRISPWLGLMGLALVLLPAPRAAALPALNLLGTFSGTYLLDGRTTAETFELEVERQHRHRLRVSIFAVDQPEFQGRGRLTSDNTTLQLHTHATGRGAPRLRGTAAVTDAGNSLTGTFSLKQVGHAEVTGTFFASR